MSSPSAGCGARLVQEDPAAGAFRVSRKAFIDEEIFRRERALIFDKSWLYVGHASEVRSANDFVTREVGGRAIIFNRDRHGKVHVFANSCPHRGAKVAREKCGNAIAFKCFYHGWAFNNNGKHATRHQPGAYPEAFGEGGAADLVHVPRYDQYRGFYFLNFDVNACSLSDYLADAKDMLDLVSDHSPEGIEIIGAAQEYGVKANWKLLVENSIDGYHASETHSTYMAYLQEASGGFEQFFSAPQEQKTHDFGGGHSAIEGRAPWGRPIANWVPAWGDQAKMDVAALRAELIARVGPERGDRIARLSRNVSIFPNLIINDIMSVTIRTFMPESPSSMTVKSWAIGPVGEAPERRKRRLDSFLEFLGPGGFATPDDVEALELCQAGYSNAAEAGWNDISRGMLRDAPLADDEGQMRTFWREWARRIGDVA